MKPIFIIFILLTLTGLAIFATHYAFGQHVTSLKTGTDSPVYDPFRHYPVYTGIDLGVSYHTKGTLVKVWSPPAQAAKMLLYRSCCNNDLLEVVNLKQDSGGIWSAELAGDRKNLYYTFQVNINGSWLAETPGPYATAVGTNGLRGQIIDPAETIPPGWANDRAPALKSANEVILYELHVRDLSVAVNSGIRNKGKYLAFTETGTVNSHGQSTGIGHIAELGVTHVHLLPVFDFVSIDESKPGVPQFNWGYDPQNYNTPEGSYATATDDGKVRIREFREMVMAMHRSGLRVVMDVVYNHTGKTHESGFDLMVPEYYYRQWSKDGTYSNASGCGNETASERFMMRKYIIESVCYWAREFHIDGFRFDLMAIHDIETMNQVAEALHHIDPSIIIYGEGWTAGDSPLPEPKRALKKHASRMNGVAVFSDDLRDGIKGSVFDDKSTGFASGDKTMSETIKFGIVAAGEHPQVDYLKVNYSKAPYTKSPSEVINYVSCHDNQTLYDKLKTSRPDATEEEIVRMHKLANTIVLTSQGIPFLHAGVEMKRTKGGEHNSYNKPDSVNRIDWDWKFENRELVDYYRNLISLRKAHPAFRMPDAAMIRRHLEFLPMKDPQLVAYLLKDHANGDPWNEILVIFNGSDREKEVELPDGAWKTALRNHSFTPDTEISAKPAIIAPISATILYR